MKKEVKLLIAGKSLLVVTDEEDIVKEAEVLINSKWMEVDNSLDEVDAFKKLYLIMLDIAIDYIKLKKSTNVLTNDDEKDIINKMDVLFEKIKKNSDMFRI